MVTKMEKHCKINEQWKNNGKTMENVRNRIDVKLVSNKKDYLKWASKPSYMPHKIFDKDLVAIRKNKVTLTLNKPHTLECAY